MLEELHWLAVWCRVDFKIVTSGGLLVTVQHGSSLPGRRLSAGLRQRSSLVSCVLPTQKHVSSNGPTAAMETDVLLLLLLGCGTAFQLI